MSKPGVCYFKVGTGRVPAKKTEADAKAKSMGSDGWMERRKDRRWKDGKTANWKLATET